MTANEKSNQDESKERECFGGGEDVLNEFARTQAAGVDESEQEDEQDGNQLLNRKANGIFAGEIDQGNKPGCGRDSRHQHSEPTRESYSNGGNGPGLNDQK